MADDNVLFMRGNDDENWDDAALIAAYDRAVNLAKEEIAQRMVDQNQPLKQPKLKSTNPPKKSKKWTVGTPCRAVYSVDGKIYEAIVKRIFKTAGGGTCIVEFIGYKNTECVDLNSLLESKGMQSQIAQEQNALMEEANNESVDSDTSSYCTHQSFKHMNERMDYDIEDPMLPKSNFMPGPSFNLTVDGTPPPPPIPPQLMAKLPENDSDALSSMLMSWYISGFHTGYYHGLKQAKINQEKKRTCQ